MAEDPSVFQYDEVVGQEAESGVCALQKVRTEALEQKKRVGLTVPQGTAVKTGSKRDARYIEKVLVATERRKAEQQIVEDRLLKKEKNAREGCEVFVTPAFATELKRRKKFEHELAEHERLDTLKSAERQEDNKGFASFYGNLLSSGLASSRGAETLVERAAPREDLPQETPKQEEAKMEPKDEKCDVKEEMEESGVSTATLLVSGKQAKLIEAEAQREEKKLSAKDRYLARKQAADSAKE
uniref:Nuclear speckle splicing regulatory protein 1 N-terminal domain-containing protein n=1 Tax=Noctiluca scintillans TaxID=2966 RepID=A0A7S0ZTM1_NOCSC